MNVLITAALKDRIKEKEKELYDITNKILDKDSIEYNSEKAALIEHELKLLTVIEKNNN